MIPDPRLLSSFSTTSALATASREAKKVGAAIYLWLCCLVVLSVSVNYKQGDEAVTYLCVEHVLDYQTQGQWLL